MKKENYEKNLKALNGGIMNNRLWYTLEEIKDDMNIGDNDFYQLRLYAKGTQIDTDEFLKRGGGDCLNGLLSGFDKFIWEFTNRNNLDNDGESLYDYYIDTCPLECEYDDVEIYHSEITSYLKELDASMQYTTEDIAQCLIDEYENRESKFIVMHGTDSAVFTEEFDSEEDANTAGAELWNRLSKNEKKHSHVMVYQTFNPGAVDEEMITSPTMFDSKTYSPIVLLEDDGNILYCEDDEEWEAVELLKALIECDEVEERLLENVVREFMRRKGYDDHEEIVKGEIIKYRHKYGRYGSGKEVTWH